MIKFDLLHPDDDLKQEEEVLPESRDESPEIEEVPAGPDTELDETVLDELDDYKRSSEELSSFGDEEEEEAEDEDEDSDGGSRRSWTLISFAAVIIILAALWLAYLLGYLPDSFSSSIDGIREKIVVLVSREKIPDGSIPEERLFEETPPSDLPAETLKAESEQIAEKPAPAAEDAETERREFLPTPQPVVDGIPEEPERGPRTIPLRDYQDLTRIAAGSEAFLEHNVTLLGLMPKGMFLSTMSSSATDVVMECRAADPAVFLAFEKAVNESGLFGKFIYIPENAPDTEGYKAIFRGDRKAGPINTDRELWDLNSERFIRKLADIANAERMNFTELRSFTVDNDYENVISTLYQVAFYATAETVRNYLISLDQIQGTYSVEKLYLSRKPTDSYPVPVKFVLYISLYESGE